MRLLVTRPEPDATRLAGALQALGHEAIVAPLMTIEMRGRAPDLAGVQALVFTSANGVRALVHHLGGRVPPLAALCVGEATAAAARAAGFARVIAAAGDVAALAASVRGACDPAAGALLHVAGSHRAGDLKGALEAAGFSVHRAVLYEAVAAPRLPEPARAALAAGEAAGVLLFSPRTARLYGRLADAAGLAAQARHIAAYCLSPAVAAALDDGRDGAVHVAPRPDLAALLGLLSS